ncbi:hypothetical protein D9758_003394 [Tetrapyrgos nigripes]|uniref:DUF6534 domain-containing protein n=1 Tax=Tetrapyrgos nigripes TaxID=182062 RepID=A0A8H5LW26_9AGAR|nr:hypothetical protein D9758_003394 [Tetrapyrgos nigripes]
MDNFGSTICTSAWVETMMHCRDDVLWGSSAFRVKCLQGIYDGPQHAWNLTGIGRNWTALERCCGLSYPIFPDDGLSFYRALFLSAPARTPHLQFYLTDSYGDWNISMPFDAFMTSYAKQSRPKVIHINSQLDKANPILNESDLYSRLISIFEARPLSNNIYFTSSRFSRDKKILKKLVWVLFFLENVQTVVVMVDAVTSFASHFGEVDQLEKIRLQWLSVPVLSALISCPVQIFYAIRIKILSKSRVKAGIVIFRKIDNSFAQLSIIQALASLFAGVPQAALQGKVTDLRGARLVPVVIWLSTTCLCDVSIAGCMLYYLRPGVTEIKQTQDYLQRVKRLTLETGALTAGIATLTLILWISFPSHTYWATPASIITKVYSNTLLASLNSRRQSVRLSHGNAGAGAGVGSWHLHSRKGSNDSGFKDSHVNDLDSVYVDCGYDNPSLGLGSAYGYGSRERAGGTHSGGMSLEGLGGQWVVSPISGKLREESIRLEYSPVGEDSERHHDGYGKDVEHGDVRLEAERNVYSGVGRSNTISSLHHAYPTDSDLGGSAMTSTASGWMPSLRLDRKTEVESSGSGSGNSDSQSDYSDWRGAQGRERRQHQPNHDSLQSDGWSRSHYASDSNIPSGPGSDDESVLRSLSLSSNLGFRVAIAKPDSSIPNHGYSNSNNIDNENANASSPSDIHGQNHDRERSRSRSSGFSRLQVPLRVRTAPLIVVSDVERGINGATAAAQS